MSFLSDGEIASLHVKHMIVHLINKQQPFAPEKQIPIQQEGFFCARIIDQAASSVHNFIDSSNVRPILEKMGKGDIGFEAGSQELSRLFWHDHVKQSTAGAFFVFQLATDVEGDILYALIKYDYRAVVELAQHQGQSVLREIIQAFAKEKRAIQKFCLARFRDNVIELDVTASDRMATAPDLTDYFENYLGVTRAKSNQELSSRLNEALRGALQEVRDHLPNKNVGAAMARAKQALQGREIVTNDDIVDAVLHGAERPDDEDLRSRFEKITRSKLRKANLTDVEFRPDRQSLMVQPRRKVRTAEDVKIEFPAEEYQRSVVHERTPDGDVFTIRTSRQLVEDDTLPIRAR